MPPTHLLNGNVNMFHPYVVGQSGTERPEPVLVTIPPAAISRTVNRVTSFAYRWRAIVSTSEVRDPRSEAHVRASEAPRPHYCVAAGAALNVNVISLFSFSPRVTLCVW